MVKSNTVGNSLVSVVITSYNYGAYVKEAIDSALNQSYKPVEIIIIDDGSVDNSKEVIDAYRDTKGVSIISRENRGVIFTRNEGVALAKGEFVIQLDADDVLEPEYIEECVRKAESDSLDIIYTQTRTFGRVEYVSEYIDYDLEKLKHDNYIHATSLVRRSLLGSEPYDAYLDKLGNEDWDLFLDLCLDGAKAGLVDKPLLNYRKHTDRQSRADSFEGLQKESLVRHHIWSKQNAKHPDQFWYFSSQINQLFETIKLLQDNTLLESEVKQLRTRVDMLESRDVPLRLKRMAKKLVGR